MLPTLVNLENLSIAERSGSETIRVHVPKLPDKPRRLQLRRGTKRKRDFVDQGAGDDTDTEVAGLSDSSKIADVSVKRKDRVRLKHIRVSEFVFPKSSYYGWEPPMPPSSERLVLQELLVGRIRFKIPSRTNGLIREFLVCEKIPDLKE